MAHQLEAEFFLSILNMFIAAECVEVLRVLEPHMDKDQESNQFDFQEFVRQKPIHRGWAIIGGFPQSSATWHDYHSPQPKVTKTCFKCFGKMSVLLKKQTNKSTKGEWRGVAIGFAMMKRLPKKMRRFLKDTMIQQIFQGCFIISGNRGGLVGPHGHGGFFQHGVLEILYAPSLVSCIVFLSCRRGWLCILPKHGATCMYWNSGRCFSMNCTP